MRNELCDFPKQKEHELTELALSTGPVKRYNFLYPVKSFALAIVKFNMGHNRVRSVEPDTISLHFIEKIFPCPKALTKFSGRFIVGHEYKKDQMFELAKCIALWKTNVLYYPYKTDTAYGNFYTNLRDTDVFFEIDEDAQQIFKETIGVPWPDHKELFIDTIVNVNTTEIYNALVRQFYKYGGDDLRVLDIIKQLKDELLKIHRGGVQIEHQKKT